MESDNFIENIHAAYAARRPNSQKLQDQARRFMPGGDTRSVTFYKLFPTFMKYGQGFTIVDVDGFEYIDFQNNYNSLIHGHAHPRITEAVTRQIQLGTVYGSPAESQFLLAEELCSRLPGADKIRFCNSGTEATLLVIDLARYFTQRYKILKMEGGYHGSHDVGQISIKPALETVGPAEKPHSVPENAGIPPNVLNELEITVQVTGTGSLAQTHFTDRQVKDWRSAATADLYLRTISQLLLLGKGIFAATRAFFNIPTPMGATEVNKLMVAVKSSLIEMRPYIENISPYLISD